ncbi:energy transducer TonB [Tenacibaculum xiamenense]|uniref:energy transducer TonB n=1 Tax=Tenacibaculum xiamenense TaxID=1261553 RepID=UPI003895F3A6
MNKHFKLTIPKPCHENWNEMRPNEKGRFCSSCAKTVVDFTQFSDKQVQEYLLNNRKQKVCGHFYRKQLDSLVIEIPERVIYHKHSFRSLFVLALVLTMGTMLLSCKTESGKVQKIEKVKIVDSVKTMENVFPDNINDIDSTRTDNNFQLNKNSTNSCEGVNSDDTIEEVIILATGEPEIEEEVMGDIVDMGVIELEESEPYPFISIKETPRFKKDKHLSEEKAKTNFQKRMNDFVQSNFDAELLQNLGLNSGKYRTYSQFIINAEGKVSQIKVRAPHEVLKKEAMDVIEKLPSFIPAKREGKIVSVSYTLPITFVVE